MVFVNTIVSSMMGWLMAKASTIIDNVWGTSQSSERKTEIMAETAKALAGSEGAEEKNNV